MTDGRRRRSREEAGGQPFTVRSPGGGEYQVRLVACDDEAYDRFYNIFANPMLWFIQHYLWDLSNAPDVRRNEVEAFEFGYNVVNDDLARAVVEEIEGVEEPVVMVHDYHLYTLPALVRRARPDVFLHHFVHIPWTQSDAWRVLPTRIRHEIYDGLLANDIIGFHTRSYRWNFLQCCRDLMDLEVDFERGHRRLRRPRGVGARLPAADRRARAIQRSAQSERVDRVRARAAAPPARPPDPARRPRRPVQERAARLHRLRPVPRAAPGVPRARHVRRAADAVADRRAGVREYLERIEAIVAVVNHRHGTPDWMPIQLKLRDDLEEAVAAYKHYDVLLVNAMFDGMNLVAKEGPMVNERDGVSILSENTGAHEELGEFALSVNPFDIQELADSIHAALTMSPAERGAPGAGAARTIVTARDPGDWIDEQLADIRKKAGVAGADAPVSRRARTRRAGGRGRGARPVATGARRPRGPACGGRRRRPGAVDRAGRRLRRGARRCAASARASASRRASPTSSAGRVARGVAAGAPRARRPRRRPALGAAGQHARGSGRGRRGQATTSGDGGQRERRRGRRWPSGRGASEIGAHALYRSAGPQIRPPRCAGCVRAARLASEALSPWLHRLPHTTSCSCSTPPRRTSSARRSSPTSSGSSPTTARRSSSTHDWGVRKTDVRDPPQGRRRVPPDPVPGLADAARRARPRPAHHRRRPALPHHQARAGHARRRRTCARAATAAGRGRCGRPSAESRRPRPSTRSASPAPLRRGPAASDASRVGATL